MRQALVFFVVGAAACTPVPHAFRCSNDASCVDGTMQGHCEATRFCSFTDGTCTSGRRYGQFAGDGLGNSCVAGGDGGVMPADMSGGDGGAPACGTLDDACCAGNVCNAGLSCESGVCHGCVSAVAAGDAFSCALKHDGTLWCWGKNDKGQLGNGTTNDALAPVRVVDGNGMPVGNIVEVGAGGAFVCARKSDGTVACWGNNDAGQLGTSSTAMSSPTPSLVPLSMVIAVAAGARHACAILQSGDVWCWGANDRGQLGPAGPAAGSNTPVQAVDKGNQPVRALAVAGGAAHTCAVEGDHSLWCWGDDGDYELGDGTHATMPQPPLQAGALGMHVTAAALGSSVSCALDDQERVSCFGFDQQDQAGVADASAANNYSVAVPTALALTQLTRVTMGAAHGCARQQGGDVWCWGSNAAGQLGVSGVSMTAMPVRPRGGAGAIAAGLTHTCAARADGVDCWGGNAGGQLGDGTTTDRSTPVAVKLACP